MDYHKIATFNEAKAYFKSLCRPMESKCALKNLQKILSFLQSPAEEICFVNMQEKYLPFYYMIVLDEEFLQTSFLTDECKVVSNEILKTLEAYRNSFTWEVSFSRQIAGIPVIFRKVYTQPRRAYLRDSYEKPIRLAFKETWIKTTLKFIKSSRLILRYPEMPHREAQYLYKGILKQNDEELGRDSLWAPVWEVLNIFKLRYEYIVSICPTSFDYLKFVCFEKVIIQRKNHALEDKNLNLPLNINKPNLLPEDNTDNDKDKASSNNEMANVLPFINHNELVKTLLEMNFTKTGTIVYTLKVDGSNSATKPVVITHQEEVYQPSDKDNISSIFENNTVESETTMQDTNLSLQDNQAADVSLTIAVQDEVNTTNIHTDLNVMSENLSQGTTILSDSQVNYQNVSTCNEDVNMSKLECNENKVIDAREKTMELEINLPCNIEKEKAIEDFNQANVISSRETEVNRNNFESQVIEPKHINVEVKDILSTVIKISDTAMNVADENGNLPRTDETDFVNENPFFQQIIKRQKQNRPLFLKEENFMSTAETNDCNPIFNDVILKNKMKTVLSNNESSDPFPNLRESLHLKKTNKHPPLSKSPTRRQVKMQRRAENKIRQKRKLLDTVSTKFILTSFKAILDFMNDDSRASMEMVSLNIHEFNVLRKLHDFSPDRVPVEEMLNDTCLDLAIQLFDRIKERNDFLQINSIKPNKKMEKYISTDGTRQRAVMFTKTPFKTPRYRIDSNSSAGTMNSYADDDSEELRTPKSILEKMHLVPPVRTKMSPGRSRITPRCNVSQSPSASVSPTRPASITPARSLVSPSAHGSVQMKSKPLDLEDISDKAKRTPPTKSTENLAVTMKTKMIEGLLVPLESDKAMRMMRLMGWNGGALGVRGIGLIEPIQPQLDVPKGVGLGHKIFKSTKLSINRLQKKVMHKKYVLEQRAGEDAIRKNNSVNISQSNEYDKHNFTLDDKDDSGTKLDVFDRSNAFERDITFEFNNKSVKNKVTDNIVENQNFTREIASNSNADRHVDDKIWLTKSKKDSKETKSFWLTNESLLQKINERSTLNNKKMKSKEKPKHKNSLTNDAFVQKNRQTVRSNSGNLIRRLQNTNNGGHDSWRVDHDEKLKPYNREKKARYFSDRTQFLVHLLDLLQSEEKRFTVVSYVKMPSKMCFGFIDSILWSLKCQVEPTVTLLPREQRIVEACAREMDAHHLQISYRLEKKFLTLVKFDDFSNNESLQADVHCSDGFEYEITHSIKDYSLDSQMLIKNVTRSKIITNRIVLEFVRSGDEERVYDYRRSPFEVRSYVISLISLLNRQMTKYQLGLGNSEHPIFREMLHRMENLCLIYRFDSHDTFISKLQLVKVDLNKRCRICQLRNVIADENYDYIDDIDIYPNRFDDSKNDSIYTSDSDVILEKSTNPSQLNNKKLYVTDCTGEIKTNEEYLIGEDWLDYDVNDETNTKNETGSKTDLNESENYKTDIQIITQKEGLNTKEKSFKNAVKNSTKKNASDEKMSSDLHNWPKRVKKSETCNENVTYQNIKWNTADQYQSDFQNVPKRKINMGQRAIKDTTKGVIKLNVPDKVLIGQFDNLLDTTNENSNQDYNIELNTDETHAGVVQNVNEREANEDIVTSDVLIEEVQANVVEDETREAFDQKAFELTKANSNTTRLKSTNVHKWPKTILIVHHDYPSYEINAEAVQSVQTAIYKAMNNGRYLPRIKCHGLKRGGIVYGCYDRKSYIWLVENLHGYTLLDYVQDLNSSYVIDMKINTFIKVDIDVILKNIELFYHNIKTASWNVIRIKDFENTCVITIKIDGASLENIRKEDYSLFIGVDKAHICVVGLRTSSSPYHKSACSTARCSRYMLSVLNALHRTGTIHSGDG